MTEQLSIRDALIHMWRRYPFLRVAVWSMLLCWAFAGVLLVLDVMNVITVPDHR